MYLILFLGTLGRNLDQILGIFINNCKYLIDIKKVNFIITDKKHEYLLLFLKLH